MKSSHKPQQTLFVLFVSFVVKKSVRRASAIAPSVPEPALERSEGRLGIFSVFSVVHSSMQKNESAKTNPF